MVSNKSITAFFIAASIIFSSCTAVQMKTGTWALRLISSSLVVFAAVQKVQAATLDVEAKRLVLQAIQENGESIKVTKYLTEKELKEIIQRGGKLEIKLSNGKEVVIQVAYKTSSNPSSKLENIIKHINKRKYVASSGQSGNFSGRITESWVQQQQNSNNSGVAASIDWDDGIVSSILLLENSRVRVWVAGIEYGGKWSWDSTGYLSVRMDGGSKYRF